MAAIDVEIRDHAYDVLEGESTVDAFEEWFVGRTWDERTPLAAHLDHLFAERSLLSEDRFRDELRGLVATIEYSEIAPSVITGTSSRTIRKPAVRSGVSETIRRRLEFAGR